MVFMIVLTLLASYAFIIGIVYNHSISRRWTTSIQILV